MGLADKLNRLSGRAVLSVSGGETSFSSTEVEIGFVDGTKISTLFWRCIEVGKQSTLSGFDHQQKYDLPAKIDALESLRVALRGKTVASATVSESSGDLTLVFNDRTSLTIFNFTGLEAWEVEFSDGTGEYSNYFDSKTGL